MKCLKPIFLSALTLITLNMPTVAQAADANAPVYNPPKRGAPAGRVGGGTRGDRTAFTLSVLAPDHTGLTTSEQPSLYWYISNPTSLPIEFTLMNPAEVKPVLETKIAPPAKPGIQRIRLADYKIRLTPNTPYRWFVAVVPDADRRSKDILAGGAIERIEMPGDLKAKLASAGKTEAPSVYAQAGIWYDSLQAISDLIEAAPQNQDLKNQRATLLSQIGLPIGGD